MTHADRGSRLAAPRGRWGVSRRLGAEGPLIVGIVNVTPDSFSDGGTHADTASAVAWGRRLWDEGADWLDIGGESARPGAQPLDVQTEAARVLPVVEALVAEIPEAVISIDTRHAQVAAAALSLGARVVNDVSGGDDPAMAGVVATSGCGWVLMHHRGIPVSGELQSEDITEELLVWSRERVARAVAGGVDPSQIALDPGLGFGKSLHDNIALIAHASALSSQGHPVLLGASRKRFIGVLSGVEHASERVFGSVGAACAAAQAGCAMIRVHDVAPTVQALRVFLACRRA